MDKLNRKQKILLSICFVMIGAFLGIATWLRGIESFTVDGMGTYLTGFFMTIFWMLPALGAYFSDNYSGYFSPKWKIAVGSGVLFFVMLILGTNFYFDFTEQGKKISDEHYAAIKRERLEKDPIAKSYHDVKILVQNLIKNISPGKVNFETLPRLAESQDPYPYILVEVSDLNDLNLIVHLDFKMFLNPEYSEEFDGYNGIHIHHAYNNEQMPQPKSIVFHKTRLSATHPYRIVQKTVRTTSFITTEKTYKYGPLDNSGNLYVKTYATELLFYSIKNNEFYAYTTIFPDYKLPKTITSNQSKFVPISQILKTVERTKKVGQDDHQMNASTNQYIKEISQGCNKLLQHINSDNRLNEEWNHSDSELDSTLDLITEIDDTITLFKFIANEDMRKQKLKELTSKYELLKPKLLDIEKARLNSTD